MTGFDEFVQLFGGISLATVIQIILAVVFAVVIYRKVRKYLIEKYEDEKERNKKIDEAVEAVSQYPKYWQQSRDIQKAFQEQISGLRDTQDKQFAMLTEMQEGINKRERNRLRDVLLQNFHYYTSDQHNPMKSWTRMESEAFWECFGDYEDLQGDGYMHTVVQPAMNDLLVIEMNDLEGITKLMASRR